MLVQQLENFCNKIVRNEYYGGSPLHATAQPRSNTSDVATTSIVVVWCISNFSQFVKHERHYTTVKYFSIYALSEKQISVETTFKTILEPYFISLVPRLLHMQLLGRSLGMRLYFM